MDFKITPVDQEAEQEGVWTEYLGVELLIARITNDVYKRAFRRLSKPHQKKIDNRTIDDKTTKDILAKSVAKGLLRDWKGFVIDGKEIPYSYENAVQLLKNDPDCLDFVMEFAQDLDNYIVEQQEETKKE